MESLKTQKRMAREAVEVLANILPARMKRSNFWISMIPLGEMELVGRVPGFI